MATGTWGSAGSNTRMVLRRNTVFSWKGSFHGRSHFGHTWVVLAVTFYWLMHVLLYYALLRNLIDGRRLKASDVFPQIDGYDSVIMLSEITVHLRNLNSAPDVSSAPLFAKRIETRMHSSGMRQSLDAYHPLVGRIPACTALAGSGWPRHRENREFGSHFFQTGKTQGILLWHREKCLDTGKIFFCDTGKNLDTGKIFDCDY